VVVVVVVVVVVAVVVVAAVVVGEVSLLTADSQRTSRALAPSGSDPLPLPPPLLQRLVLLRQP